MNVLSRLHSEIQIASSRLENPGIDKDRGDLSDDDFADVDREMLMMPHKSRKQIYSSAVRQRHRVAIRPMARHNEKAIQHQLAWWNSFISNFASQEVVSRYDTTIAVLAIESLYMFVVESYQEDRYGVVLRDLAGVINLLVQLIQTIDKYFRLKANGIVSSSGDNNVKLLDSTLQTALLRINGKFGDDLRWVPLHILINSRPKICSKVLLLWCLCIDRLAFVSSLCLMLVQIRCFNDFEHFSGFLLRKLTPKRRSNDFLAAESLPKEYVK
ncbi:unnamed protein product [Nippostrongylus brasiliensis]|uniref:Nucleoporin ndc-1 (inferred by orthology to a C. elegans protein) n=1 Tax=Nippostrongylus brasiliensis TaxID=27835 RepID=A0A0N4XN77_NIPBR|nr:unnamed protein product [Nippostrongylus brasiliensis]